MQTFKELEILLSKVLKTNRRAQTYINQNSGLNFKYHDFDFSLGKNILGYFYSLIANNF